MAIGSLTRDRTQIQAAPLPANELTSFSQTRR